MTLEELRDAVAAMSRLPGDTPVILAKDAEGNQYREAHELEQAWWVEGWQERHETDTGDDAVKAVFIWPH